MSQTALERKTTQKTRAPRIGNILAGISCLALVIVLGVTALELKEVPAELTPPVMENLNAAQVDQPVTAVLLNFRGYDTWLEVGVLVIVVLSVLALHRIHGLPLPATGPTDPVLAPVTRLLFPLMVLLAGLLLWAGTRAPGGAFQAGAVLGAAGVLLRVAGIAPWLDRLMLGQSLRILSLLGFVFFLVVAASTLISGRSFLEYPVGWAGSLIFTIETAVTISIGWTLAFLYMGATPREIETKEQSAMTGGGSAQ